MIVRILPEAEIELFQAMEWYEGREPTVGFRLLDAFEYARRQIVERADRLPVLETIESDRDIRRVFLRQFPFMIVFELLPDESVIIAFAHFRKRPDYWEGRIQ